jgi:glycosyltransferase involved in cell wall biosynthesis
MLDTVYESAVLGETGMRHTFAICAYKESPYLALTIESLKKQTVKSEIFIATSTPNGYIRTIAEQFHIEIIVNEKKNQGICGDWNFAYAQAKTDLVTLAHQDDYYEPDFTEKILAGIEKKGDMLIAFTDYFEIRGERKVNSNRLMAIKRLMLIPFLFLSNNKFIRSRVLSLGNPICCPSITYNKKRFPDFKFSSDYKCSLDWEAVCRLSKENGGFIYINKPLMGHRISGQSETTSSILNGVRYEEDFRILCAFWPESIARIIMGLYAKSMDSNKI